MRARGFLPRRFLGLESTLWDLNRTLAVGAFRSLGRRSLSVSGLYLIGILVVGGLLAFLDRGAIAHMVSKMFFLFSPVILTILALFAARSGLTGTAFFFTPAETSFLLTAPLSHVQLVRYKFYQMTLLLLLVTLIGSACLVKDPRAVPEIFGRVFLLLLFLQLTPIVLNSFVRDEQAWPVVLLRRGLDLLLVCLLVSMGTSMYFRVLGNLRLSIFSATIFAGLTAPLAAVDLQLWHNNPLVSGRIVRQLFLADGLLMALVAWRAPHLRIESLLYKNQRQRRWRARRSGWWREVFRGAGPARVAPVSVPEFRGGLGPLLWRKGKECARHLPAMTLLTVLVGLGFSAIVLFFLKVNSYDPSTPLFLPWHLLFCAECFTLLALLFSRFADFRADGDKMETLLTLPVSAPKLLLGELLPGLAYLTALLTVLFTVGSLLYARTGVSVGLVTFFVGALVSLPIRALLFLMAASLIALVFPVPRVVASTGAVALVTQFFAELFGLGLLGRLLFSLESWAHAVTADRVPDYSGFFLLTALPLLAGVTLGGWALIQSLRRFNPAKLVAL